MILLALGAACLGRLLEGPLVLAARLGEATSIAPDPAGGMLVATRTGLIRVDGKGAATPVSDTPADAITTTDAGTFVLAGGRVTWPGGAVDAPGAVDVLAGWDDAVFVLFPDRLERLDPAAQRLAPVWTPPSRARALALGAEDEVLIVTDRALWSVRPLGPRRLASGLTDPRAAATDARGRVWVVDGDALYRVEAGKTSLAARYLGDVRDVHVGVGGAFPPEDLFLVTADGTVASVRPP